MRLIRRGMILWMMALLAPAVAARADDPPVRVGSKSFTESVILGELATQLARSAGAHAIHRRELGGTRVLWDALRRRDIDVYPEYTGTIAREIFSGRDIRSPEQMRAALAESGVGITLSLGFNNTYAIGMRQDVASRLGIDAISQLASHPQLKFGFSNEFLDRADGWPALRQQYALEQANVRGMDHDLAYRALEDGSIDATDLYLTDARIARARLRILQDDRHVFPEYNAVFLYRTDLQQRMPQVVQRMRLLQGRISARQMIRMNAAAQIEHVPEAQVAADFLGAALNIHTQNRADTVLRAILRRTAEHLYLVGISLIAAIIVALPLGIFAARHEKIGQVILAIVAGIYTIPSLALLVFMIPLLGIGAKPAIVALFLYSLLPILRNTQSGLRGIPPAIRESAEALGLPAFARLIHVELPMASPAILAGVKTSAVINVGTAALGALIGAGGYGQPILTGIRLDDVSLILQGAAPAAAMALLTQAVFEILERLIVPRGLRSATT